MHKSSSHKQQPLIRSLSNNLEDNQNYISNSLSNKKPEIMEDSLTQPTYKNNPIEQKDYREFEEEDDIRNDPIFIKLIEKQKYSDSNDCEICNQSFGIFKQRKNCAFCGRAVCKSHLIKKRENPQIRGTFEKICEICEEKYLNRIVLEDFFKKKKKKEDDIKLIERKLFEIKQELLIKQNEYSKAQMQREENEKNFQEKLLLLSKNINKKRQLTDKLEEENKQLNDKDIAINEAIKEENSKTNEYKNELEKITKQCEDVSLESLRVEKEIKRLTKIISETEQKIEVYKFNKDHKEPRDSNQNNSMMLSLISGAEGSLVDMHNSVAKMQNSKLKDQPVEDKRPCCWLF